MSFSFNPMNNIVNRQPTCYSKRCNQLALVIYRHQWLCVVHALATARIRQLIRRLGGGK